MPSGLYVGHVTHARHGRPGHAFRYPLFMLLLDPDELGALDRRLWLFGHGRRRAVSFREADHFAGSGSLAERLSRAVRAAGASWPGGRVLALTHARIFGYVFNPVSFYFCHGPDGALALVVAEVNNTFGERHVYVLDERCAAPAPAGDAGARADVLTAGAGARADALRRWRTKKVFHVSPFKSLDGTYTFTLAPPGATLDVRIALTVGAETRFAATLALTRRPLTDLALARVLLRYPFMTAQVMAAIHWHALRLWWKGAIYRARPRTIPRPRSGEPSPDR